MLRLILFKAIVFVAVSTSVVGTALAQSNIDDTVPNQRAWSENTGWTNWRDANGAAQGANTTTLHLGPPAEAEVFHFDAGTA